MADTILVISPDNRTFPQLEGKVRYLRFRFNDSEVKGAFSASIDSQGSGYHLLTACEPVTGSFLEQGLNRPVAAAILDARPVAVYIVGVYGCTWDLLRISRWLGIKCYWQIGKKDLTRLPSAESASGRLIGQVLKKAEAVVLEPGVEVEALGEYRQYITRFEHYHDISGHRISEQGELASGWNQGFDYTLYEVLQRDHPLLYRQQVSRAGLFEGCRRVLDLGCGVGVFLDLLRAQGIEAEGVERNTGLVEYAREMGLTVHQSDALTFLQDATQTYDGIYCSHFVEHLPFPAVEALIQQAAAALVPGGVLVLAFPDPESIRSQLLGFWRDPEHVRFYHPQLITTLAKAAGLQCEWSSYDDQPHQVIPFPVTMPPLPETPETPVSPLPKMGLWQRCLEKLGLATSTALQSQCQPLQQRLDAQEQLNRALVDRLESLWAVNATWGWNDDVTLKLRKPHENE